MDTYLGCALLVSRTVRSPLLVEAGVPGVVGVSSFGGFPDFRPLGFFRFFLA